MRRLDAVDVLLVEDDPNDAELTLRALRQGKVANSVEVLSDGAEALESIFGTEGFAEQPQRKPKVILLDLKLPKVGGLEILKRLKTDDRTNHIPVVILTSSVEERDMVHGYKLGANSYIIKPVDFEKFTTSVAEIGGYWLLLNESSR